MKFADVIVDIADSEVDKIFEYSFEGIAVRAGCRVVVPFGNQKIEGYVIEVKDSSAYPVERIKPILSVLDELPAITEEGLSLMRFMQKRYFAPAASVLRLFLPAEMRQGKIREQISRYYVLKEGDYAQMEASLRSTAVKQRAALAYLKENGRIRAPLLNEKFGREAILGLYGKGLIEVLSERENRSPYRDISSEDKPVRLTARQQEAVKGIENTEKTVALLHGVTGSGKTEVYLNLIQNAIARGKTAVFLVPEIALTPQMLRQLRARFGDSAAILHSGLSAGERYDEWWRLRRGEAKIAIGARSAVFAPLEHLGLIIIDEEHDGSYRSETSPRYSTFDIAKFRAEHCGAKLVLGSATPAVETYRRALRGEFFLAELPDRINRRPLPEIIIADMRQEIRRGNHTAFSSYLKEELETCLEKGNQAILFLNQRGYSKSVICTECGYVPKCEQCDVSLTYHIDENALKCHYCNARYKMLSACPNCGSTYLRHGGTGTQRIVMELQKMFPAAKILRMDRDTTQTKEGHYKILEQFSARKADILVGTQMIAKGHDFPSVTLVGILDADMSLHFSDYRSGERTFQLLTQVAGRSGRAEEKGKVVLQTYSPDNYVLGFATDYDYKGFYTHEIALRKATAFPPYTDIVRVLIQSEKEEEAIDVLKRLHRELNAFYLDNERDFRFFGYMKAPIKRIQKKYRYQILMQLNSGKREQIEAIYKISLPYKTKSVLVQVEENPNNLT